MNRKILNFIVLLSIICANPTISFASNVIWLNDAKTKDIFNNGLEELKDKLYSNSKISKRMLRNVMGINLDKNEIYFNKDEFKIFVEMEGRTLLKDNNSKSCRTLIKKAKRLLFGTAEKENLMSYFPTVDFDDLRYFIHFKAKIVSWTIIADNGKIIDVNIKADLNDIPKDAVNSKTTFCSSNIMSKKIFYDTKIIE